jgi:hypothetical protein
MPPFKTGSRLTSPRISSPGTTQPSTFFGLGALIVHSRNFHLSKPFALTSPGGFSTHPSPFPPLTSLSFAHFISNFTPPTSPFITKGPPLDSASNRFPFSSATPSLIQYITADAEADATALSANTASRASRSNLILDIETTSSRPERSGLHFLASPMSLSKAASRTRIRAQAWSDMDRRSRWRPRTGAAHILKRAPSHHSSSGDRAILHRPRRKGASQAATYIAHMFPTRSSQRPEAILRVSGVGPHPDTGSGPTRLSLA